ncbi:MAG: hypothetical protein ACRDY4_15360 [Acidimicrobiia bacterium]
MTLRVLRILFLVVGVVAGVAGTIMLVAPNETDRYFSWPIGPPPLAATVGGFYVASAVVFTQAAFRDDWPAARGLCVGVIALTVPTVVFTIRHHDVFDFGRWQAIAWIVLFVAAPIAYGTILFVQRGQVAAAGDALVAWARVVVALLALAYAALALVLWLDPTGTADRAPYPLPAMSGRFLGCWAAFLTALALFVVVRNQWNEARTPLLALTLWPVGGLVGALRSFDDLAPSGRRAASVVGLGVAAAAGALVLVAGRARVSASAPRR